MTNSKIQNHVTNDFFDISINTGLPEAKQQDHAFVSAKPVQIAKYAGQRFVSASPRDILRPSRRSISCLLSFIFSACITLILGLAASLASTPFSVMICFFVGVVSGCYFYKKDLSSADDGRYFSIHLGFFAAILFPMIFVPLSALTVMAMILIASGYGLGSFLTLLIIPASEHPHIS